VFGRCLGCEENGSVASSLCTKRILNVRSASTSLERLDRDVRYKVSVNQGSCLLGSGLLVQVEYELHEKEDCAKQHQFVSGMFVSRIIRETLTVPHKVRRSNNREPKYLT